MPYRRRTADADGYVGEAVAAGYDASCAEMFAPRVVAPAVEFLAGLAGDGGRALKLGVWTGRIALPLAGRGVRVHGIDRSRAMVERLRAEPGGTAVPVTIGDFATTRVPGTFDVAYPVFDTVMNLTSQDAQVDCFRTAAAQLEPGGCSVVAVGVPELRRLPPGQEAVPGARAAAGVRRVRRGDAVGRLAPRGGRGRPGHLPRDPLPVRLAGRAGPHGPARRDAAAGAVERWSGWERSAFTGESRRHVSVWEKTGAW